MYKIKFASLVATGTFDKIVWASSEEEASNIFAVERPGSIIIDIQKLH